MTAHQLAFYDAMTPQLTLDDATAITQQAKETTMQTYDMTAKVDYKGRPQPETKIEVIGWIAKCGRKDCKHVARIDGTRTSEYSLSSGKFYTKANGWQYAPHWVTFPTYSDPGTYGPTPQFGNCPACGYWMKGKEIKGEIVATIKCGMNCQTATGDTCRCECGGLNHGGRHTMIEDAA